MIAEPWLGHVVLGVRARLRSFIKPVTSDRLLAALPDLYFVTQIIPLVFSTSICSIALAAEVIGVPTKHSCRSQHKVDRTSNAYHSR